MLDEPPELIPVDKPSDDPIVHTFRLRKAARPTYQPLNPRPQIHVFALDFLGMLFADGVLLGLDMPLIGAPAIGVEAGEAQGLQSHLQVQQDVILAPAKHLG